MNSLTTSYTFLGVSQDFRRADGTIFRQENRIASLIRQRRKRVGPNNSWLDELAKHYGPDETS